MYPLRWYYSTWFICLLFALWFLIIPLVIGIILVKKQERIIASFYEEFKLNTLVELEGYKKKLTR
ncbi:hypothetical protein [Priestia megaterium]|uniref:hypothetical protein n=1 Tax=Priestia megaterium TaxID=1404 RepID=UPI002E1F2740|nr:hypothetical protein [Priestia megaterium]